MSPAPDFLIIGAMKSATSTLHEQLARQPGVFMSTPKEPNFFSDDPIYARGFEWYRGLFAGGAEALLRGESSTHYTKLPTHPHAVERIARHLPQVKLIYVMRHPIDRLISHYIHDWSERRIEEPIEQAIERHPELVAYGRYAMQLRPYLTRFGDDRVLPVFFDRLRTEPHQELVRICRFLGYGREPRWHADVERQNVSSQRMRRSPLRDAVVEQPLLRVLRRALVPKALRERIRDLWRMKEPPALSPERRNALAACFDEDLAELGAWLGIDLRCDNFSRVTCAPDLSWSRCAPGHAA